MKRYNFKTQRIQNFEDRLQKINEIFKIQLKLEKIEKKNKN